MTAYLTSSKMPFADKDGHLTKAFQEEKHDTASQLLKEYANRNESSLVKSFSKKLINSVLFLFGSGGRPTGSCRHCSV